MVVTPCFASTKYHFPARISVYVRTCNHKHRQRQLTHIYHYSNMVWNIVFAYIDKEIASLGEGRVTSSLVISCIVIKKVKAGICSTRHDQFPNRRQQEV